jgi:hypothetical protein
LVDTDVLQERMDGTRDVQQELLTAEHVEPLAMGHERNDGHDRRRRRRRR